MMLSVPNVLALTVLADFLKHADHYDSTVQLEQPVLAAEQIHYWIQFVSAIHEVTNM